MSRQEYLVIIAVITAIVVVICSGIASCILNNTQTNAIELACYQRGGHMEKAKGAENYLTCEGQKQ